MAGSINIKPQIFATYIKNGSINIKPQIFATYIFDGNALVNLSVDTDRNLSIDTNIFVDTSRSIAENAISSAIDTTRIISNSSSVAATTDTRRDIQRSTNLALDTVRNLSKSVVIDTIIDTSRKINNTLNFFVDTKRDTAASVDLLMNTQRIIYYTSNLKIDTQRYRMNIIDNQDIISATLTIDSGALTDSFSVETVASLDIDAKFVGRLLDYELNLKVNSTSQQFDTQTASCTYDVDDLLYTPFTYYSSGITAKDHVKNIANAIDKNLVWQAENFQPSNTYNGAGATYDNIINGVFGWTTRLPRREIHVFLRGNNLYIIQRGYEDGTVDISDMKHSRPIVERKKIRSVWSSKAGSKSAHNNGADSSTSPQPYSGTITFGDASVTYSRGLAVAETHDGSTTTKSYSGDYIVRSYTTRSDGSTVEVIYGYAVTLHDKYLATETETVTDKNGNSTVTITRHYPLGHGWYGTTVEQDGEYQHSEISQGKTGGKTNRYTEDESNSSLGGVYSSGDAGGAVELNGSSLIDTDFPVSGYTTLNELTREIEWMNGKIEETISIDVWGLDTVLDFRRTITWNGSIYYLDSNTVRWTPDERRQSIKMVRWY